MLVTRMGSQTNLAPIVLGVWLPSAGVLYSGTSDKGPSEIRTTSINDRQKINVPIGHFVCKLTSEIRTTSLQGQLKCPNVSFIRRLHCIIINNQRIAI